MRQIRLSDHARRQRDDTGEVGLAMPAEERRRIGAARLSPAEGLRYPDGQQLLHQGVRKRLVDWEVQ